MNANINSHQLMRTEIANSRDQFAQLVKEAHKHLSPEGRRPPEFWYRGHDRGIYTLTPTLFRYQHPEEKELRLFDIYARNVGDLVNHRAGSWARVAWMQHYGIPTRLLDWTTKLGIGVYFAVKFLVGKSREREPNDDRPCVYVLNPMLLNEKNGVFRLPRVPNDGEPEFEKLFSRTAPNPIEYPLAVAPVDAALNPRLRAQQGCFTVHGVEPDPLECQAPDCVFCISLTEQLCDDFRHDIDDSGPDVLSLFPDHLGIVQFVASKADLQLISYDQRSARAIRRRLKDLSEQGRTPAHQQAGDDDYIRRFGACNFEQAYIPRPKEAEELVTRLRQGPPFVFVTGEAGIGKTNFILQNLLYNGELKERLSLVFPLKLCDSISLEGSAPGLSNQGLMPHVYEVMIGKSRTAQDEQVARQMIREGDVVLALDGLDELARNKGQEAVKAVIYELESLVANSTTARIVISCRDHIFERLKETGSLGRSANTKPISIGRFDRETIRKALERELGCDSAGLAVIAETPLLYQMIRSAKDQLPRLAAACKNSTRLQEAWFRIMLKDDDDSLDKLGVIAGEMLKRRCDVLDVKALGEDMASLVERLSKPPFVLFIEEERKGTHSFSHQSLREFVLAWCVYTEIKASHFALLTSSPSFDYEGGEYYARVHDLVEINLNLDKHIIATLHWLLTAKDGPRDDDWNHLARNLFEMLGELLPDDDAIAEAATKIALRYLNPEPNLPHYVSFKTRYNVARCLERVHYSAPRPYFRHTLEFHSTWRKSPLDHNRIAAWAIRGFHMIKQKPRPLPPTVFNDRATPPGLEQIEIEVSNALMRAIQEMNTAELPEDATFLGINCTHALIRWLPQEPDQDQSQIQHLLKHRHTTNPMRQNIFWALYRRYRADIPPCFKGQGFFRNCDILLSLYDGKCWASEEAQKVYEALLRADS